MQYSSFLIRPLKSPDIKEEYKYYALAFLKSNFFKDQLVLKVPRGATIRHAGKKFLECKIPFPNQSNKNRN